jgi:hypothetical protein
LKRSPFNSSNIYIDRSALAQDVCIRARHRRPGQRATPRVLLAPSSPHISSRRHGQDRKQQAIWERAVNVAARIPSGPMSQIDPTQHREPDSGRQDGLSPRLTSSELSVPHAMNTPPRVEARSERERAGPKWPRFIISLPFSPSSALAIHLFPAPELLPHSDGRGDRGPPCQKRPCSGRRTLGWP